MMPEETKSNRTLYIFWGAIILISVFVGINFLLWYRGTSPLSTNSARQAQPSPLPKEASVQLTAQGFSPSTVTIAKGSAVRWVNSSGQQGTVNSDDHPTNKKFPEMNLGTFAQGASLVHIFTNSGTYTYHNYLKPEEKGTVIVK